MISNPRGSRPLASYSFGVEAIHELMGALEDVRRFDAAILVAAGQVDSATMTASHEVTHRYTQELCRRLILWSWSRPTDNIKVPKDALESLRKAANSLVGTFSETMPLVDRGTIMQKLGRLSAALAARTFSSSEDGLTIVVRECHVEWVERFLRTQYSRREFGYEAYSTAQDQLGRIRDPNKVARYIKQSTQFPRDLVEGLLYRDDIMAADIQDWCSCDREIAQSHLSFLVRQHAVRRMRRNQYAKTPGFIDLLREIRNSVPTTPEDDPESEL